MCGHLFKSFLSSTWLVSRVRLILTAERLIEARVQRIISIHSGLRQLGAELLIQRIIPETKQSKVEATTTRAIKFHTWRGQNVGLG